MVPGSVVTISIVVSLSVVNGVKVVPKSLVTGPEVVPESVVSSSNVVPVSVLSGPKVVAFSVVTGFTVLSGFTDVSCSSVVSSVVLSSSVSSSLVVVVTTTLPTVSVKTEIISFRLVTGVNEAPAGGVDSKLPDLVFSTKADFTLLISAALVFALATEFFVTWLTNVIVAPILYFPGTVGSKGHVMTMLVASILVKKIVI